MTSKQEVRQEVLSSMETIRGLRHGFRVADLAFSMGAMPETITAALSELVVEGVLVVVRKAGRVNVYGAA